MNLKIVKLSVVVLAVLFLFSCENDGEQDDTSVKKENVVALGSEHYAKSKPVLGRGYDATGKFCDITLAKEAVLDYEKLLGKDKIIRDDNLDQTEAGVMEGKTIEEYQNSFSFSLGAGGYSKFKAFSAEAKENFDIKTTAYNDYSYVSVTSVTRKYGIFIDGRNSPSDLLQYRTNSFAEKINSLNFDSEQAVNAFIAAYGTHVVTAGIWGASLFYNMSAKRIQTSTDFSLGVYAEATANAKVFKASFKNKYEHDFKKYFQAASLQKRITVKGGKSEYALEIVNNPSNKNYEKWIETISGNPIFCNYYDESLIPLWEFVEDAGKKEKLQKAVAAYFKSKGIGTAEGTKGITLTKDFEFYGNDHFKNARSDQSINTHDDKYTGVTIDVEIEIGSDRKHLIAEISAKYEEGGVGHSKTENRLKKGRHVKIYSEREILKINEEKTGWHYSKSIKGKKHNYNSLPHENCKWLKNVKVSYDVDAGDDLKHSGIKGTFEIKVVVPNRE